MLNLIKKIFKKWFSNENPIKHYETYDVYLKEISKEKNPFFKHFKEIKNPEITKKIDLELDEFPNNYNLINCDTFSASNDRLNTNPIREHLNTNEAHKKLNEYLTNTKELTCSCKDWMITRRQYAKKDPRRLCKHLINKLDPNEIDNYFPYFRNDIQFYKESYKGFRRDFTGIKDFSNFGLMLFISDWSNVYSLEGYRYGFRFNWDTGEGEWSKNQKPNNYKKIEDYFLEQYINPCPLVREEMEELGSFLMNFKDYKRREISICINSSYLLPPGILCYNVLCLDFRIKHEVRNIFVNKHYLRIDYFEHDSEYFERLKIVNDVDIVNGWQNYEPKQTINKDQFGEFLIPYYELNINGYINEDIVLNNHFEAISKTTFHRRMNILGLMKKVSNNWYFTEEGLDYGYNILYARTYNKSVMNYPLYSYDYKTEEINKYSKIHQYHNSLLYPACKPFFCLLKIPLLKNIIIDDWAKRKEIKKEESIKNTKISNQELIKNKWLKYVECKFCKGKDLIRKDKRKRTFGWVQRFYCKNCEKTFQYSEIEKPILFEEEKYKKSI